MPPWSPDFPPSSIRRRAAIRPSGMGSCGRPWSRCQPQDEKLPRPPAGPVDVLHQGIERLDEFLHAFVFELRCDAREIHPEPAEIGNDPPGLVDPLIDRAPYRA